MIRKIRSGGQTGVDRAALDIALEADIPCGGWCAAGRQAEDGLIPQIYPLRETPAADPAQRTEWNVRDADGTLILTLGPAHGGTRWTLQCAERLGKPALQVDLLQPPDLEAVRRWLRIWKIRELNVAGPRESTDPGAYQRARGFLKKLLKIPSRRSMSRHAGAEGR